MSLDRERAEQDLHVIRSLMERATVYRAISAPTAFCAALFSIGGAITVHQADLRSRQFAAVWLVVLVLALLANTFFVWREAKRDRRPLISAPMKMAMRAVIPCLIIPAAVTIWFLGVGYLGGQELLLVGAWVAFYGLALLSTTIFAPRSLVILGWCFLISALGLPVIANSDLVTLNGAELANLLMAITFGGYHLVYALCTWRRRARAEVPELSFE
ncbi:MAG: hypothetical protein ACJ8KU_08205 [Chthoniobacterales bacterium]